MANKLSIVGTPIGNLEDISFRAIRVLKEADMILCEDTRLSQRLLNHYDIKNKKLISYHKFNERQITSKIIDLVKDRNVALISDAGMPCISDPGFNLISEAKKHHIFIDVIGGPTAMIHAFIKSNLGSSFSFLGFLKDKSGERQNQLKKLSEGVYVSYISPYKLLATLDDFNEVFGSEAQLYLCKELTKIHEQDFEGTAAEIKNMLNDQNLKGEFVLVFLIKKPKTKKVNKYESLKNKQKTSDLE
ncbi:16S rRNA (cytidine(1402)-2'-O)-methyltransferase [Mycoplasma enhydrae]|uniref:16S rRNA (cytidine(1402)-2'-O)-methyltransferase n=1 Tax=Mycoplasma enhydrae TaxID=2499220 RepID=UPI00197BDD91|nr:16S rRNA (cytidine(1402)-2'-O)-methyltransferase [Mycoplasma enhydrae]MBN4089268.1 16S rRNA (cytidine(1402)-2'-O)-methyltransferase [Mycoplasma enhydrae]MCV3733572.1 16S rRNA (cytidine(1402)-2'-O)-methyltransferase [Mycoplasma enhydrae]MCV3753452.1 16S rRNA (cytidine(1402)-2'-O)-methyltransferase [Mycoplasma enhydrae]